MAPEFPTDHPVILIQVKSMSVAVSMTTLDSILELLESEALRVSDFLTEPNWKNNSFLLANEVDKNKLLLFSEGCLTYPVLDRTGYDFITTQDYRLSDAVSGDGVS